MGGRRHRTTSASIYLARSHRPRPGGAAVLDPVDRARRARDGLARRSRRRGCRIGSAASRSSTPSCAVGAVGHGRGVALAPRRAALIEAASSALSSRHLPGGRLGADDRHHPEGLVGPVHGASQRRHRVGRRPRHCHRRDAHGRRRRLDEAGAGPRVAWLRRWAVRRRRRSCCGRSTSAAGTMTRRSGRWPDPARRGRLGRRQALRASGRATHGPQVGSGPRQLAGRIAASGSGARYSHGMKAQR